MSPFLTTLYLQVIAFVLICPLTSYAGDWRDLARDLFEENQGQVTHAVQELRSFPLLEASLQSAIVGPDQELALKVVSELRVKGLVPDLLAALSGPTPSLHLITTLNSLIDDSNSKPISQRYLALLSRSERTTGAAETMALLDGLSNTGANLDHDSLMRLLADRSYEVRDATVRHAGRILLKQSNDTAALLVLRKALTQDPYQTRLEAIRSIASLPNRQAQNFRDELSKCARDPNTYVRFECAQVQSTLKGDK